MKSFLVKNIQWVICSICLVLFLILLKNVFSKGIMQIDMVGYHLVSSYLIRESTIPIAKGITWFGSGICLSSITAVIFFFLKDKRIGLMIIADLIIIAIFNTILKVLIQRPRPTEFRIINERGYSFPSAHSMASMAFYGLLIYLIYKGVGNIYLKWILIVILFLLIISIGISRIYLGVHYTSDVLAGFLISLAYLILFISVATKYLSIK